jgi:elongator complex protein 3
MEDALLEILEALRAGQKVDAAWLDKLVRRYNKAAHDATRQVAKRRLLPYYFKVRAEEPERYARWQVTDELHTALVKLLQAKPRRTASGVATITVLTKPWPCSSNCLYCPNDVRMPKSYLSDEPACQRAERCWFDPYLQVAARLRVLADMGHVTDKVELIVLGGTWSDYPLAYQRWFIGELFAALNDAPDVREKKRAARTAFYQGLGLPRERNECAAFAEEVQHKVTNAGMTYNHAWRELYDARAHKQVALCIEGEEGGTEEGAPCSAEDGAPRPLSQTQLEVLHDENVMAAHRVVGLVIETRPDLITNESCQQLRSLGCTKVQLGIQSLNDDILRLNKRNITSERLAHALALLRLYGFKSHIHFMVNLVGSTPESDCADYARLVNDPAFLPDEVKLYPCCLVESSELVHAYEAGAWQPYSEEDLVRVLATDVLATPPYTRISRMIRDISAHDIMAGNKKTNLRQVVEAATYASGTPVQEIRSREIATDGIHLENLSFNVVEYETLVSTERFMQWVTPENKIAGFLRLSLPHAEAPARFGASFPAVGDAMIREVHVYGKVAALQKTSDGAQHLGLGTRLVNEACRQALEAGYTGMNVISAVGTRAYYARLGFEDAGLYQRRPLVGE